MSAPAEVLLARLEGVRGAGDGQWMARCPAHADRNPSLSIRETGTGDGRVLLHCFGGCSVADILGTIGLSFANLFPPREHADHHHRTRGDGGVWMRDNRVADARWSAGRDATYVWLAAEAMGRGDALTDVDRAALVGAAKRLRVAADRMWASRAGK